MGIDLPSGPHYRASQTIEGNKASDGISRFRAAARTSKDIGRSLGLLSRFPTMDGSDGRKGGEKGGGGLDTEAGSQQ